MIRRILAWIDEQTELVSIMERFMREPLPKGTGWPHVFGTAALFMFVVQAATGIFLMVYYVPSPDNAYETVQYIQRRIMFGSFVRGVHHWGASAMLLMVGLHMLQTFFWGAYKPPRQIIWVLGVALLLLTLTFSFTGYLLPWDQKAYWATVVGTNIPRSIPAIGEWVRDLIRGGAAVGAITLTRFFALHVFFLPVALGGLIIFHMFQVRKKHLTPAWRRVGDETDVERPVLFYPDQTFKGALFSLLVLGAVMVLVWRVGAPIEPVANPADTAYVPRPEWYFLWLFQLLKYFPGSLEFVGAIVLPGLAAVLLIIYPYLDGNPERRPLRRPFATALAVLTFCGVSTLGVAAIVTAPREEKLTAVQQRGQKIFMDLRCNTCHGINGGGGNAGPDLAQGGPYKVERTQKVIVEPTAFSPRSIMPVTQLPREELNALVAYVSALNPHSRMPFMPAVGPKRPSSHLEENWFVNHKFEVRKDPSQCATCHKRAFCQSCHQKRRPDSHLGEWLKIHYGNAVERPEYCRVCHEQSFCDKCHAEVLHGPDWLKTHRLGVAKRPGICGQCHRVPESCNTCHRGVRPEFHTTEWIKTHGATAVKQPALCLSCHSTSTCQDCHALRARPAGVPPTPVKPGKLPPETYSPADVQAGKAIYREQCAGCHGDNGKGNPDMAAVMRNLDITDAARKSPDTLAQAIRGGKGMMPAFEKLSDQELQRLLLYLRTLGGKG